MGKFFLIFRHYLYRLAKEPISILVNFLLPLCLIVVNNVIADANFENNFHIVDGYNISASATAIAIVLMFQMFAGTLVVDGLYNEIRGTLRWRLSAAPASINNYIFANFFASVIVSVLLSLLLFAVSHVLFNAYFPSLPILFAVLVVLSIFSQLCGTLLFMLVAQKRVAEAIIMLYTFIMVGGFGTLVGDLGFTGALRFFFSYATPYAISMRILLNSGFTGLEPLLEAFADTEFEIGDDMSIVGANLGILIAMTVVLAIIVALFRKRRLF